MTRSALTLLMTRPRPAAERFVAMLPPSVLACLATCYAPLVSIEPTVAEIDIGNADLLVFTSANGVECASGLGVSTDLPCVCVGHATTEAATRGGWQAQYMGATADELIAALLAMELPGPVLHLRGVHARGGVAQRLEQAGAEARDLAIYDQILHPLSPDAKRHLSGKTPVLVPLFSPRTAAQFAREHSGAAPLHIVSLSDAVAQEVAELPSLTHLVAKRPDAAAMEIEIENVVNQVCRVEGGPDAQ